MLVKNEAYQWYWKKCESLLWQGPELLLLAASLYVIPEKQLIMCLLILIDFTF